MHSVSGGGGEEAAAAVPRVGVPGGLLHGHGADVVDLDRAGHGDGQQRGVQNSTVFFPYKTTARRYSLRFYLLGRWHTRFSRSMLI